MDGDDKRNSYDKCLSFERIEEASTSYLAVTSTYVRCDMFVWMGEWSDVCMCRSVSYRRVTSPKGSIKIHVNKYRYTLHDTLHITHYTL